jgi:hypothetical protein
VEEYEEDLGGENGGYRLDNRGREEMWKLLKAARRTKNMVEANSGMVKFPIPDGVIEIEQVGSFWREVLKYMEARGRGGLIRRVAGTFRDMDGDSGLADRAREFVEKNEPEKKEAGTEVEKAEKQETVERSEEELRRATKRQSRGLELLLKHDMDIEKAKKEMMEEYSEKEANAVLKSLTREGEEEGEEEVGSSEDESEETEKMISILSAMAAGKQEEEEQFEAVCYKLDLDAAKELEGVVPERISDEDKKLLLEETRKDYYATWLIPSKVYNENKEMRVAIAQMKLREGSSYLRFSEV